VEGGSPIASKREETLRHGRFEAFAGFENVHGSVNGGLRRTGPIAS